MKKIAMLTTFMGFLESYSLCQVARQQLKVLKKYGYDVKLIYRGGGGWSDVVAQEALIPDYIMDNDGSFKGMEARSGKPLLQLVMDTLAALEKELQGIELVITHDLIYQSSNTIQDMAASMYSQKHPEVRWLHWVHSATSPQSLGKTKIEKYRNAVVCYPNSWDIPRVARNFNVEETQIKVVPHPLDYEEFFNWHPLTTQLVKDKNLMEAEALAVYPLRLDRGKQPEILLEIMHELKTACKKSIRVVIIDFQSSGGDKVTYRNEMMEWAIKQGWTSNELTFMSQYDKSCHIETPKWVVRDLLLLSNIYVHPSKSETYSLTTQEARACKNLLVLNFDFPPTMSIYGDGPLYKKFSSCCDSRDNSAVDICTNTAYHDRPGYMRDIAKALACQLQDNAVIRMSTDTRRNRNLDTVFTRYLEPLLYTE